MTPKQERTKFWETLGDMVLSRKTTALMYISSEDYEKFCKQEQEIGRLRQKVAALEAEITLSREHDKR